MPTGASERWGLTLCSQSDGSPGTSPLPQYAQCNRDRGEDADAKECPSSTPPLIFIEPFGQEQSDSSAKGHTGAADQGNLRDCKTSLFHVLSGANRSPSAKK